MRPAHRDTPEGRISRTAGSPIIGRRRSAGFGFLSSVAGRPVFGRVGSRSQTTVAAQPPAAFADLYLGVAAWVIQVPVGSPDPGRARPTTRWRQPARWRQSGRIAISSKVSTTLKSALRSMLRANRCNKDRPVARKREDEYIAGRSGTTKTTRTGAGPRPRPHRAGRRSASAALRHVARCVAIFAAMSDGAKLYRERSKQCCRTASGRFSAGRFSRRRRAAEPCNGDAAEFGLFQPSIIRDVGITVADFSLPPPCRTWSGA